MIFEEEPGPMCEGTAMPFLGLPTCNPSFTKCRLEIPQFPISAILQFSVWHWENPPQSRETVSQLKEYKTWFEARLKINFSDHRFQDSTAAEASALASCLLPNSSFIFARSSLNCLSLEQINQFIQAPLPSSCLPMTPQHLHIFLDLFVILNGFPRPHFLMNVFQFIFKPVNLSLTIYIVVLIKILPKLV